MSFTASRVLVCTLSIFRAISSAECALWLASSLSDGISGRLISAQWDNWAGLPAQREALAKSDVYTLRRVTPRDKGWDWGDPA